MIFIVKNNCSGFKNISRHRGRSDINGDGCTRVSLRLPLSTTHQIVREMYDFIQKEIGYMSGSICWILILFSGWVKHIIFYH
jgi:hypothetical protein